MIKTNYPLLTIFNNSTYSYNLICIYFLKLIIFYLNSLLSFFIKIKTLFQFEVGYGKYNPKYLWKSG